MGGELGSFAIRKAWSSGVDRDCTRETYFWTDDLFVTTDSVERKADIRMPALCTGCLAFRVASSGRTLILEKFRTTSSWTMFIALEQKKISGIVHMIALTTAKVMRERG